MSDDEKGNPELINGSIFERQMQLFFEVFGDSEYFDLIPEEHRDVMVGIMNFTAFHISLATRAYAMTLLKDAPKTPAISDFDYDTRNMFKFVGSDLDRVLHMAQRMHPEAEKARQHYM